jgi:nitrate/nitrite-specific signal transduction histidine kinase
MKRKIIIYLSALFVFFSLGVIPSIMYMQSSYKEFNHIINLHEVEQLRRSLVIHLQAVQSDLYTVKTPLSSDLDMIINHVMNLESTAKECSSCHHPPRLNDRIVKVQSLIRDYQEHLSFYITVRANEERMKNLKTQAAQIGNKILNETAGMSHSASQSLKDLTKENTEKIQYVMKILFTTTAVTFLLGIVVALILTRSVLRPIKLILDATRMISSGKLGTTISYKDKTEFGELAKNFNNMSIGLKEREERLEEKSEELKKRVNELEEFYKMAVGRELKMKELKEEINRINLQLSRYKNNEKS